MAGNFSFSGIGSGIDGRALAEALGNRTRLPNAQYQNQISANKSETSSLERLRTLLLSLGDSLDGARTANGGAGAPQAVSSDSNILKAYASQSAQFGSFVVSVQSLATAATASFAKSYNSPEAFLIDNQSSAGNLEFTVGEGEDAVSFSVAVDEQTTLQGFVSQFNSLSNESAQAFLVQLGSADSPDYRVSFRTTELGTEVGAFSVNVNNSALLESAGVQGVFVEQATNAAFSVSGIQGSFSRSTNSVSDAIAGVTLELSQTGIAGVTVQGSSTGAAQQIEGFIRNFNSIVNFADSENLVTSQSLGSEKTNTFGSLARTSTDDNVIQAIRTAVSESHSQDGTVSLASIGISTNRDGTIAFDRKKFDEVYQAHPEQTLEAVSSLADKISGVSGVVYQYTAYGAAFDQAVQANQLSTEHLNGTIEEIDRRASEQERLALAQFSNLESLYAKLVGNADYLSSLLKF